MTPNARLLVESPLATITLTNAAKRNALGLETMRGITALLVKASQDPSVGAIVLRGEGPAFSAGHDIKEMIDQPAEYYDELFGACTEMMNTVHEVPQPVIAVVDGVASAAGCQLVATADLGVATEESTFATPGVRIGLFCSTPMVPVSRAVGRKRAMEMLLTGEPISAATAADWGLINRSVPAAELEAEVDAMVAAVTKYSLATIAVGKAAFYRQDGLHEADAYGLTQEIMARNAEGATAQEGMCAFVEKRSPDWPKEN